MHRDEILQQLQPKIGNYQQQLTALFFELLSETNADQGFLAFEDLNGKLSIVASRGDYWHLSRDQGATGMAVKNGRPSITDPQDSVFHKTDREPFSELIYPVKLQEEVVGAILLDNFKPISFHGDVHYPLLQRHVDRIGEVLTDADPWNFRKWWQDQQSMKREGLFDSVHGFAQEVLDDAKKTNPESMLEARVEAITYEGTLSIYKQPLGQPGVSRASDRDTVATVRRTGRPIDRAAGITKFERHVPFPLEGPVQGIVTFVSETELGFPDDLVDGLVRRLQRLDYQHFAPAVPDGRQGAEHYFHLVLAALTAAAVPDRLHVVLERIARRAQALCAADLQILYTPPHGQATAPTERVRGATRPELVDHLAAIEPIERPYCYTADGWLRCPVLVRGELKGLVQVRSEPHGLSNLYNSDIVVVVALLVAELIARSSATVMA